MEIEVDGAAELVRALDTLEKGLQGTELVKVLRAAAKPVEDQIERATPVRSGRLRDTIRTTGGRSGAVIRAGTARVPYAGVINYGTKKTSVRPSNIQGRHFMEAGVEAGQDDAVALTDRLVAEFIERTIRS